MLSICLLQKPIPCEDSRCEYNASNQCFSKHCTVGQREHREYCDKGNYCQY